MSEPKPSVVRELKIDDIDWRACQAARSQLNQEAVEDYAATEAEWSDAAPAAVWLGGGQFYAGDGNHRRMAKLKNGKKEIRCSVVECESVEAAEMLAWEFALGAANSEHKALRRSDDDKRASVCAALARPEYATASDRKIAEVCRVVHSTVASLRKKMTVAGELQGEPATTDPTRVKASEERKKKPDGAGVAAPPPDNPSDISPAGPASVGKRTYALTDAKGRVIPEPLAATFVAGRQFVRAARELMNEIHEAATSAAAEAWGPGIKAILSNVEGDFKRVGEDFFGSVPYVLCPHLGPDGQHLYGGVCKFCLNGRGWFTKNNFLQLSDDKRKLFDAESKSEAA